MIAVAVGASHRYKSRQEVKDGPLGITRHRLFSKTVQNRHIVHISLTVTNRPIGHTTALFNLTARVPTIHMRTRATARR